MKFGHPVSTDIAQKLLCFNGLEGHVGRTEMDVLDDASRDQHSRVEIYLHRPDSSW